MDETTVAFEPTFTDVTGTIHSLIDIMALSVQRIKRVEHQLFYEEDGMKLRHISSVDLGEDTVKHAKERASAIVGMNSKGPLK